MSTTNIGQKASQLIRTGLTLGTTLALTAPAVMAAQTSAIAVNGSDSSFVNGLSTGALAYALSFAAQMLRPTAQFLRADRPSINWRKVDTVAKAGAALGFFVGT